MKYNFEKKEDKKGGRKIVGKMHYLFQKEIHGLLISYYIESLERKSNKTDFNSKAVKLQLKALTGRSTYICILSVDN